MDGTKLAPEGQTWVCLACGKTSRTRNGWDESGKRVSSYGYDESCMLHAKLFLKTDLVLTPSGRVYSIKGPEIKVKEESSP